MATWTRAERDFIRAAEDNALRWRGDDPMVVVQLTEHYDMVSERACLAALGRIKQLRGMTVGDKDAERAATGDAPLREERPDASAEGYQRRLRLLIQQCGGNTSAAAILGVTPQLISMWTKNGGKYRPSAAAEQQLMEHAAWSVRRLYCDEEEPALISSVSTDLQVSLRWLVMLVRKGAHLRDAEAARALFTDLEKRLVPLLRTVSPDHLRRCVAMSDDVTGSQQEHAENEVQSPPA